MKYSTDLTAEEVRSFLHYDPVTGVFVRTYSSTNPRLIGKEAGRIDLNGYRVIRIGRKICKAHRLAWLMMTGVWPENQIDHINMDCSDNRWCNLREATHSENKANSKLYRNNKIGIKGVRLHTCGMYESRIRKNGKLYYLGLFKSLDDAQLAYVKAAAELHGEFARPS